MSPSFEAPPVQNKPEMDFTKKQQEKHERQVRTIEVVLRQAENLGIKERVFLMGAFSAGLHRPHKDIDFAVQRESNLDALEEGLLSIGFVREQNEALQGSPKRDYSAAPESGHASLDIRFLEPETRNGVLVWRYPLPNHLQSRLKRPLAIPDSAFITEQTVDLGGKTITTNVIAPEFTYLTKLGGEEGGQREKDQNDARLLEQKINKDRLDRIKEDLEKADIEISFLNAEITDHQ